MNALFLNVPGHGGNGFTSAGAGAVSPAALAGLLLTICPSPPSCLPTQTSHQWGPLAQQGIWAREKMLLSLFPACRTEQRRPSQCSDQQEMLLAMRVAQAGNAAAVGTPSPRWDAAGEASSHLR